MLAAMGPPGGHPTFSTVVAVAMQATRRGARAVKARCCRQDCFMDWAILLGVTSFPALTEMPCFWRWPSRFRVFPWANPVPVP